MSNDMERIMREIHVMFAKAEKIPSREDMIIVDKKRVFALLESLSHEVYNAMDRYEETKVSRELGIQKYKEETDAMVEKASISAEEIYAGSILYSDSTLKELEAEVTKAREDIQRTWEEIDKKIVDKLNYLSANRKELKGQLEQMEQGRIYLELIGKAKIQEKEEKEEQKRLNTVAKVREKQEAKKTEIIDEIIEESGLTEEQKKIEIYVAEAYKNKVDMPKAEEQPVLEKVQEFQAEDFDLDAEYFAWKEEINGAPSASYPVETKKGLKDIFKRIK
ncbi:MAG: hypothetical protein HFG39_02775 [Lachnospiraceae bacterium]|nr:hypothetical protein [Lachnospiraceae bacterium]